MKELQSILLENIKISLPGILIRRVALNQHMPRVEKLSEHCHDHHQWLLYLRGRGVQHVGSQSREVRRGTVLWVREQEFHRFIKESEVRPLCLVIDFEGDDLPVTQWQGTMSDGELQEVEQLLIEIHEQSRRNDSELLSVVSLILQAMVIMKCALQRGQTLSTSGPSRRQVEQAIASIGLTAASPRKIADLCGCSLDHLNRRLRNECGKTVGNILNEARMATASQMLASSSRSVGEVGAAIGMDDQNYFSRWFRKQTRQTPTQWRTVRVDLS